MESSQSEVTELIKRVRKIELRTRGMVRETFGGAYQSCFKGQGIDFEDFREYQPGDEVRTIDWNVTARMGQPFIKNFVEQRELSVYICVDISPSGEFGSVDLSKRELMAEVSALMAFSAAQNQDKVGLLLFSDDVELYLEPKKGRGHCLRIIREILHYQPKGRGTSLKPACDVLQNAVRRRSLVLMLSDFLFESDEYKTLKGVASKHDLVAMQFSDPAERKLPSVGYIRMADPETGQQVEINTSNPRLRATYAKAANHWQANLEKSLKQLKIDHIRFNTEDDYIAAIQRFFIARSKAS